MGGKKASTETVCEVREKVNKLFPGARKQTKSYRNRPRDMGLRGVLVGNMASKEYSPPFIFSVSLRVPLYRLRYHQPL